MQTPHTFAGISRIQTGFLVGRFVFTPTHKVASKTFKKTYRQDFSLNILFSPLHRRFSLRPLRKHTDRISRWTFCFHPSQRVVSKTFKKTNYTDALCFNCRDLLWYINNFYLPPLCTALNSQMSPNRSMNDAYEATKIYLHWWEYTLLIPTSLFNFRYKFFYIYTGKSATVYITTKKNKYLGRYIGANGKPF